MKKMAAILCILALGFAGCATTGNGARSDKATSDNGTGLKSIKVGGETTIRAGMYR